MCVIGAKKRGILLPTNIEEILRASFRCNGDGAGIAIKRAGTAGVHYEKGLMTISDLIAAFRNLGKIGAADEFAYHCRIKTHGALSKAMTHPFIMSKDFNEVSGIVGDKTSGTSMKPILFHNGVISEYQTNYGSKYSDTFNFTHQFMSRFDTTLKNRKLKLWQKQFVKTTIGQKLCIMFPEKGEEMELRGRYYTVNGMFYSNNHFFSLLREEEHSTIGYI